MKHLGLHTGRPPRQLAATLLLAMLALSMIPYGFAVAAAEEAGGRGSATVSTNTTASPAGGNATVSAGVNLTVSAGTGVEALRAKLLLISGLLRGILASANLSLNASPEQVASALNIDTTIAAKLLEYANMSASKVYSMSLGDLKAALMEAAAVYRTVAVKIATSAEKSGVIQTAVKRIQLVAAERLAEIAKKVAEYSNDTALEELAARLEAAVREGNTTAARLLYNELMERIQAENLYLAASKVNEALTRVLEDLARIGNATAVNKGLVEKLFHDIKRLERIVERYAERSAGKVAKEPHALEKLVATAALLEDLNETASIVGSLRAGVAAAAAAEALAAKLEARISADYKAAVQVNDTKAIKLLIKANETLARAKELIDQGNYVGALRLLTRVQVLVVRAEARIMVEAQMGDIAKELSIRGMMPVLLPPWILRKHILPVIPGVHGAVGKMQAKTVEHVIKQANATISETLALLETINQIVSEKNITLKDRVVDLVDEAWSLVKEANKTLIEAKELLEKGNIAEAVTEALSALRLSVKARAYAHAALGAVTADIASMEGWHKALEIRKRVEKEYREMAEKIKHSVENIIEIIMNKTKKAREAGKKVGKRAEEVFNETMANLIKAQIVSIAIQVKELRLAVKNLARLGFNLSSVDETLAEAQDLLKDAEAKLKKASSLAEQGNVEKAQELLEEALEKVTEAASTIKEAFKETSEKLKEAFENIKKIKAMIEETLQEINDLLGVVKAQHEMASELNMTARVGVNATTLREAERLARQALWMINESLYALQKGIREGNVTMIADASVLAAKASGLLEKIQHMLRESSEQALHSLQQIIRHLDKMVEDKLNAAFKVDAAIQVLVASGYATPSVEEAKRLVANSTTLLGEAKRLLAEALESDNVSLAEQLASKAKKLYVDAVANLKEAVKRVTEALLDARNKLLDRINKLYGNITGLEAKIAALRAKAAFNQTLQEQLDEAENLLEEAKAHLGNAQQLLAWEKGGRRVDVYAKLAAWASLLVNAKSEVEIAAANVGKAASIVAQVDASLSAGGSGGGSSSGGSSGTPTPPKPGNMP